MSNINPGDIVEHRTSDDRYVVATTGLVCCVRMLEGVRITDFFHAHELEVTEAAERVEVTARVSTPDGMRAVADEYAAAASALRPGDAVGPPRAAADRYGCCVCKSRDDQGCFVGCPVRTDGKRAELDVEDARETLEDAGWFLVSPEGHVTSMGNIEVDSPAWPTIVESCSSILVNRGWSVRRPVGGLDADAEESERMAHQLAERGWAVVWPDGTFAGELLDLIREETCADVLVSRDWAVFQHDGDEYAALPLPDEYEAAILKGVSDGKLSAALVDKGWTVVVDEDGSRLYPPEKPPRYVLDSIETGSLTTELASRGWAVGVTEGGPALYPPEDSDKGCHQCTHLRGGVSCDAGKDPWAEECDGWEPRLDAPTTITTEQHIAALEAEGYRVVEPRDEALQLRANCGGCAKLLLGEDAPWSCADGLEIRVDADVVGGPCDGHEPEQGEAIGYPTPPACLEEDGVPEQLAWLRANGLPTGTGKGKNQKTEQVIMLLRHGYYDPETVESIVGDLAWPPGPAKCPVVVEDGEPCGSTEPETCEHPLPAVPGESG